MTKQDFSLKASDVLDYMESEWMNYASNYTRDKKILRFRFNGRGEYNVSVGGETICRTSDIAFAVDAFNSLLA